MKRRLLKVVPIYVMILLIICFSLSYSNSVKAEAQLKSGYWWINAAGFNKAIGKINSSKKVKVAVLDSGVSPKSEELRKVTLRGEGYNYVSNNSSFFDDYGHGTEVASVIAAAFGYYKGSGKELPLSILPVKVLDSKGKGTPDELVKGIYYAADEGADVINISIAFEKKDKNIQRAIEYANSKNIAVVVSSGNYGENCDNISPAGDKGVVTVASVDKNLKRAWFSNYGFSVMTAAPGTSIAVTDNRGKIILVDGTSYSSAIVSAEIAIIKMEKPDLKFSDIERIIKDSIMNSKIGERNQYTGYGMINIDKIITEITKNTFVIFR